MPSLGLSGKISHDTERKIMPGREVYLACDLFECRSKAIPPLIVSSGVERISANEGDAKPQGLPVGFPNP